MHLILSDERPHRIFWGDTKEEAIRRLLPWANALRIPPDGFELRVRPAPGAAGLVGLVDLVVAYAPWVDGSKADEQIRVVEGLRVQAHRGEGRPPWRAELDGALVDQIRLAAAELAADVFFGEDYFQAGPLNLIPDPLPLEVYPRTTWVEDATWSRPFDLIEPMDSVGWIRLCETGHLFPDSPTGTMEARKAMAALFRAALAEGHPDIPFHYVVAAGQVWEAAQALPGNVPERLGAEPVTGAGEIRLAVMGSFQDHAPQLPDVAALVHFVTFLVQKYGLEGPDVPGGVGGPEDVLVVHQAAGRRLFLLTDWTREWVKDRLGTLSLDRRARMDQAEEEAPEEA